MVEGACPTHEPVLRERLLSDFLPIGLAVPGRRESSENTSRSGSIRRFGTASGAFDFLPMLTALDAVEEERLRVPVLLLVLGLHSAAGQSTEELNLTTVSFDGV